MKEVRIRLTVIFTAAVLILGVTVLLILKDNKASDGNVIAAVAAETEEILYTSVPEQSNTLQSENFITSSVSETEPVENEETTAGGSSERIIITSRARKEYDNNAVYIDMKNILQLPELPVGCEITALAILLNHYGFDADKSDLARNYLPIGKNWREEDGKIYKDSFFDFFIGDPFSRGYGCFSNAIEKAAAGYIKDNGGGYTVLNISGAHPDDLYDYLTQGIPVIVWATDGMIEPEYYETWYDHATGEQLDWYLNEHCFVLAGFNMSGETVTLNDPMKGIIDYNINKFETRYEQMHSQAIVIIKDEAVDETADDYV